MNVFLISRLLEKTRKSVEQGAGIVWNEYPTADILEPHLRDTFGNRAIFPLHRTLKLQPMSIELKQQLRENCQQLHRFKNLYVKKKIFTLHDNYFKILFFFFFVCAGRQHPYSIVENTAICAKFIWHPQLRSDII